MHKLSCLQTSTLCQNGQPPDDCQSSQNLRSQLRSPRNRISEAAAKPARPRTLCQSSDETSLCGLLAAGGQRGRRREGLLFCLLLSPLLLLFEPGYIMLDLRLFFFFFRWHDRCICATQKKKKQNKTHPRWNHGRNSSIQCAKANQPICFLVSRRKRKKKDKEKRKLISCRLTTRSKANLIEFQGRQHRGTRDAPPPARALPDTAGVT